MLSCIITCNLYVQCISSLTPHSPCRSVFRTVWQRSEYISYLALKNISCNQHTYRYTFWTLTFWRVPGKQWMKINRNSTAECLKNEVQCVLDSWKICYSLFSRSQENPRIVDPNGVWRLNLCWTISHNFVIKMLVLWQMISSSFAGSSVTHFGH